MLLEHGADDSVLMKIIEMKNKVVVIAGFAVLAFIVWLAIAIKNNQRPERIMVDIVDTMAPESWELRKELEKKEEVRPFTNVARSTSLYTGWFPVPSVPVSVPISALPFVQIQKKKASEGGQRLSLYTGVCVCVCVCV